MKRTASVLTDESGFIPTLQDGSRFRYEISSTASSSTNLDTEQGGVGGAKVVDVLCLPYAAAGDNRDWIQSIMWHLYSNR